MTATIVGMSRPERIAETIRYLTTPIPEALWDEIEIPVRHGRPEVNRRTRLNWQAVGDQGFPDPATPPDSFDPAPCGQSHRAVSCAP